MNAENVSRVKKKIHLSTSSTNLSLYHQCTDQPEVKRERSSGTFSFPIFLMDSWRKPLSLDVVSPITLPFGKNYLLQHCVPWATRNQSRETKFYNQLITHRCQWRQSLRSDWNRPLPVVRYGRRLASVWTTSSCKPSTLSRAWFSCFLYSKCNFSSPISNSHVLIQSQSPPVRL